MREIDIYRYYSSGYNYNVLRFISEGGPIHGKSSLISIIDSFLSFLNELNLQVTLTAAEELLELRKRIEVLSKESKIDTALSTEVRTIINKIDTTLDAELKLRSAFIVTPKRFQLENLLEKPENIFGSQIFQKLPPICQFDFKEACRCIAFDLPTSAAFHIMRGTEGVLRFYYCSIVKRKRVQRLLWNEMIEHLRKRRGPPEKALMDNMDNIRYNFRNPTQHPDARYHIDQAQDLLAIGVDVINRMIRDLEAKKILPYFRPIPAPPTSKN